MSITVLNLKRSIRTLLSLESRILRRLIISSITFISKNPIKFEVFTLSWVSRALTMQSIDRVCLHISGNQWVAIYYLHSVMMLLITDCDISASSIQGFLHSWSNSQVYLILYLWYRKKFSGYLYGFFSKNQMESSEAEQMWRNGCLTSFGSISLGPLLNLQDSFQSKVLPTWNKNLWWVDPGWMLGAYQSQSVTPPAQLDRGEKIQCKAHGLR